MSKIEKMHYEGFVRLGKYFRTQVYPMTSKRVRRDQLAMCKYKKCGKVVCKTKRQIAKDRHCGCQEYKIRFGDDDVSDMCRLAKYGASALEIAKIKGCSYLTVLNYVHKLGMPFNSPEDNEGAKWKGCGDITDIHFSKIRSNAEDVGSQFNVTSEFIWNLFLKQEGKCNLTGEDLTIIDGDDNTAILDRIDCTVGYTEDNVQWIHREVKMIKWNMSQNTFLNICNKISDHQRKTNERNSV